MSPWEGKIVKSLSVLDGAGLCDHDDMVRLYETEVDRAVPCWREIPNLPHPADYVQYHHQFHFEWLSS